MPKQKTKEKQTYIECVIDVSEKVVIRQENERVSESEIQRIKKER